MLPALAAAIPALISAAGSIGGGILSNMGNRKKETHTQRQQRKLIDQLIASLGGEGPFSDLFNFDEATFQKSYVDPAKAMFKNQIAPQIQQSFIASGQQRGTGLDDQLLRAGVDLDQLLNQSMMEQKTGAMNRKTGAINNILSQGGGAQGNISTGQAAAQGGAGFLSSDAFGSLIQSFMKKPAQNIGNDIYGGGRTGFENNSFSFGG